MNCDTVTGGKLDGIPIEHRKVRQFAIIGIRRDFEDIRALKKYGLAVWIRDAQAWLEQPLLVSLFLLRWLIVDKEKGNEPALVVKTRSAANLDVWKCRDRC
jgi:hypothetical protein